MYALYVDAARRRCAETDAVQRAELWPEFGPELRSASKRPLRTAANRVDLGRSWRDGVLSECQTRLPAHRRAPTRWSGWDPRRAPTRSPPRRRFHGQRRRSGACASAQGFPIYTANDRARVVGALAREGGPGAARCSAHVVRVEVGPHLLGAVHGAGARSAGWPEPAGARAPPPLRRVPRVDLQQPWCAARPGHGGSLGNCGARSGPGAQRRLPVPPRPHPHLPAALRRLPQPMHASCATWLVQSRIAPSAASRGNRPATTRSALPPRTTLPAAGLEAAAPRMPSVDLLEGVVDAADAGDDAIHAVALSVAQVLAEPHLPRGLGSAAAAAAAAPRARGGAAPATTRGSSTGPRSTRAASSSARCRRPSSSTSDVISSCTFSSGAMHPSGKCHPSAIRVPCGITRPNEVP